MSDMKWSKIHLLNSYLIAILLEWQQGLLDTQVVVLYHRCLYRNRHLQKNRIARKFQHLYELHQQRLHHFDSGPHFLMFWNRRGQQGLILKSFLFICYNIYAQIFFYFLSINLSTTYVGFNAFNSLAIAPQICAPNEKPMQWNLATFKPLLNKLDSASATSFASWE